MNKIDDAWAVLRKLPEREQEIAADAILDYASRDDGLALSDEQAAEVRRRLADKDAKTITPEELRALLTEP